jgi:ferredoxin
MSWRVTLENRDGVSFPIEAEQTVLDAATAAGVPLVAGCRYGACLTCAVRLRTGRVHYPEGTGLTDEMTAAHVVLACVTTVSSDVTLVVGKPDAPLLHPRHLKPWTD